MSDLMGMQRFPVEDHIRGLQHEADALRAERARDQRTRAQRARDERTHRAVAVDAPAHDGVETHALDAAAIAGTPVPVMAIAPGTGAGDPVGAAAPSGSPRVRLGRWLVGVGAAVAGSELDELVKRGDDNSPFSHAA